jgi:NADH-quinone oxidoreductase subunit E
MSPARNITEDPAKRAMLLTALYIAQEQYGYLSDEAIERVAQRLGLLPKEVLSTASFYTLYNLEPSARYRIQVCSGLSCYLNHGAEPILELVRAKLGLQEGETRTKDAKFSVEVVECLAACDTSPNIRINDDLYPNLTAATLDALLDKLSEE